jgi:hypothetical protein
VTRDARLPASRRADLGVHAPRDDHRGRSVHFQPRRRHGGRGGRDVRLVPTEIDASLGDEAARNSRPPTG